MALTAAALAVAAVFRPWLRPFHLPQRGGPQSTFRAGDLTPLFAVWNQVTARSLFDGHRFPLWSGHIYCGEPFFAKPQVGVLSLTTMLTGLVRYGCGISAVAAAQLVAPWTFLVHLWLAGLAAYVWGLEAMGLSRRSQPGQRQLGGSDRTWSDCAAAACGAVVFMLCALMAEHTMMGHGPIVLAAAWSPLVLWALGRALIGPRPARPAALAGLLLAVQLLAGGGTVFLYTVLAGAALVLCWLGWGLVLGGEPCAAPESDWRQRGQGTAGREPGPSRLRVRLARAALAVSITGWVGFSLAAVKVLPGMQLLAVTNRAGGLPLAEATGRVVEFTEPALLRWLDQGPAALTDARTWLPLTLLLAVLGIVSGLRSRSARWLTLSAVALILLGAAADHSKHLFALLWYAMPVFRYQRIPQRALLLTYLGLTVLVSLGAGCVLSGRIWPSHGPGRSGRSTGRLAAAGRLACGLLLPTALFIESWYALPALPPTADIRREVASNEILNYLARQPGRFRIHAVESTDRNWGIEHVTVPLGLNNLVGWDHLWLLEYLGAEGTRGRDVLPFLTMSYMARHPARFWGMMNVRFVTATRPIELPGLRLVRKFPPCPPCQPPKSAGPFLYQNEQCMPRGWLVPQAVLVLGNLAEQMAASYALIDDPQFDPRRLVVVRDDRRPEQLPAAELAAFEAVFVPQRWRAALTGPTRWIRFRLDRPGLWLDPQRVHDVLRRGGAGRPGAGSTPRAAPGSSGGGPAPASPAFHRYSPNAVRLSLPARAGFLVLAEKYAHFPGWRAESAAGPRPLLKANAVATAIALDGTERWLRIRYWPAPLSYGLLLAVAGAVSALVMAFGLPGRTA